VNLVVPPTCGDLREHTDSADRRWRTVAGQADPFISMADKNLVADNRRSVLAPTATNCDGTALTSLKTGDGIQGVLSAGGLSVAIRPMVAAASPRGGTRIGRRSRRCGGPRPQGFLTPLVRR